MLTINKKEIKHLAALSRLELTEKEEEKLMHDLAGILDHFKELEAVDTKGVVPLTGGTQMVNVFREDEPERTGDAGKGRDQFPEEHDGYLKTPAVF